MNPLTRLVGTSLLHLIILKLLHAPLFLHYSTQWSNNGAMQLSRNATIQRNGMITWRNGCCTVTQCNTATHRNNYYGLTQQMVNEDTMQKHSSSFAKYEICNWRTMRQQQSHATIRKVSLFGAAWFGVAWFGAAYFGGANHLAFCFSFRALRCRVLPCKALLCFLALRFRAFRCRMLPCAKGGKQSRAAVAVAFAARRLAIVTATTCRRIQLLSDEVLMWRGRTGSQLHRSGNSTQWGHYCKPRNSDSISAFQSPETGCE